MGGVTEGCGIQSSRGGMTLGCGIEAGGAV